MGLGHGSSFPRDSSFISQYKQNPTLDESKCLILANVFRLLGEKKSLEPL